MSFSSKIFENDKRNVEKTRSDTNSRLKNFCREKNINLLSNDNRRTTSGYQTTSPK